MHRTWQTLLPLLIALIALGRLIEPAFANSVVGDCEDNEPFNSGIDSIGRLTYENDVRDAHVQITCENRLVDPNGNYGQKEYNWAIYNNLHDGGGPSEEFVIVGVDTAIQKNGRQTDTFSVAPDNNNGLEASRFSRAKVEAGITVELTIDGNPFYFVLQTTAIGSNTLKGFTITAGTPPMTSSTAATTSEEEQQQAAATHTQNRATNIANNQPNVTRFIDGTFEQGGGSLGNFGLVANEAGFTSRFSSSLGRIWSEMDRNTAKAMAGSVVNSDALSYLAEDEALQNGLILAPASKEGEQSHTAIADPALGVSGNSQTSSDENTYGSAASVENTSQLSAAQQRGYDVWMQVYGAKSEAGNSESTLWIGYAGAHKFINPNLLIGGLVQIDWADESNNTAGSSADGTGWMVGPYIAAKMPDQNLFFDARAAWGRSDNDITTTGATGSFETERWMVSAKVSGLFRENGWDIRPAVSASYFEETQESYTDSTSTVIASQTFTQGEVRFGPTFSYDLVQDDGSIIRPKAGVNGVWNFDVNNGANSQGAVLGSGDLRARFDAGVTIIGTNMWSLDLSGFYDGIGINNYYAYGGKARLTVPLN